MCGGGGTQVSTSTTEPWEEQIPYLTSGFKEAQRLYNRGAPEYYPGETLAGFDPMEKAGQQATLGYAMGPRAAGQQAAAEASLIQGLSGKIDPSAYNPMVNALSSNVISNLQGKILPGIRQQQVMYQPGGSSRGALEQNKAVTNAVTQGMTKPLADMYTNAYTQAQNRALQSGQLYPSIMAAPLNMYGAMGGVGEQRRAMTQEGIDQDMARYQYQSNAGQNALRNYMAMVTGDYGSTTTSTTPAPKDNTIANLVGTLGSAYLMAGSDIHVKENIIPEGTKWKGLNVYNYNYIGDSTPRRGVMAQQVEGIYPDAVTTINGVKHVNYGAI